MLTNDLGDGQAMMSDGHAGVRCTALKALANVLKDVEALPPGDLKIFNECGPSKVTLYTCPND
jgi:hypothetical protein